MGKLAVILLSIVTATTFFVAAMPRTTVHEGVVGSGWNLYTAAYIGDDVCGWTSIALDDNDWPYIAYYNVSNNYALELANWNGSGWRIQTIDPYISFGCFDTGLSLALDRQGHPHIAYAEHIHHEFRYAEWNGSSWSIQTIETRSYPGFGFVSIALDGKGFAHISYFSEYRYDLKYARWNGTAWEIKTVDSLGVTGLWTSIDLDKNDYPHIGYLHQDTVDLRYASWNGSAWRIETVDSTGSVGYFSSMKLDSSDTPHFSYYDYDNSDLKYATWNGSAWRTETVDSYDMVGWFTSIAIDSSDYPRISYWAHPNISDLQRLKYAEWNGSAWSIEVADSRPGAGWFPSIALDSIDLPHISYLGYVSPTNPFSVKYATKSDLSPRSKPSLSYTPDILDFGNVPPTTAREASFEIWNSGGRKLTYTLDESTPWITAINPASGSSTGEHDNVAVSIDTAGLSLGIHTGAVSISSNGGNGTVQVSVNVTAPTRHISLNIDPDTLNKKSRGRWITAYLTVENASPDDIDPASLLLNDAVSPSWWDVQSDKTLMVKFDLAAVQEIVPVSDSVDIKVMGRWRDGGSFELHDTIRVISP